MDSKFRIAVLISGRGSNLEALLREIEGSAIEAALAVSDNPAAPGLQTAAVFNVPTRVIPRRPKEISRAQYTAELRDLLLGTGADLIVLAGFMRILGREVIDAFPNRIINIHPSLLPQFPGLDAQRQALEGGVRFSGCTVHFVTGEVDAGPIIAQTCVPVRSNDTVESLSARILREEHRLLPTVVIRIARGEIPFGPRLRGGQRIVLDPHLETEYQDQGWMSIRPIETD